MGTMTDKVAVITGAGRGVGFGIAQEMAEAGAQVVLVDLTQDAVDAAAEEVGDGAVGIAADVTSQQSMRDLYRTVADRYGHLDAVVANAGVGDGAPLGSIQEAQFDFIVGVNLKGTLFTVQEALPYLHSGATAVLIGSTASVQSQGGMSIYGATKAGLRMYVRTWIRDLHGTGIRVNMLSPGAIDTLSLRKAFADASGEDNVDANVRRMGEQAPLGRLGTPRDIGKAAVFLSTDQSSFITGIELFVDGGVAQTG